MIIGSLNLLQSSEKNREMGVFLEKINDTNQEAFDDAYTEAEEIIRESKPKNCK